MACIKSLPINDTPEIFGLHDNANITFAQNETFRTLSDLLDLQPKTLSSGGATKEEIMEKRAKEILHKIVEPIKLEPVMNKYPVLYEQSMNTVLIQEVYRYNTLLVIMKKQIRNLLEHKENEKIQASFYKYNVGSNQITRCLVPMRSHNSSVDQCQF